MEEVVQVTVRNNTCNLILLACLIMANDTLRRRQEGGVSFIQRRTGKLLPKQYFLTGPVASKSIVSLLSLKSKAWL
jgi:hypothetical protein